MTTPTPNFLDNILENTNGTFEDFINELFGITKEEGGKLTTTETLPRSLCIKYEGGSGNRLHIHSDPDTKGIFEGNLEGEIQLCLHIKV